MIWFFKRKEYQSPKYISWYKEPRWRYKPLHLQIEYLMKNCEGDWEYTNNKNDAYKFKTAELAKQHLPIYDGSCKIEERTGIERM